MRNTVLRDWYSELTVPKSDDFRGRRFRVVMLTGLFPAMRKHWKRFNEISLYSEWDGCNIKGDLNGNHSKWGYFRLIPVSTIRDLKGYFMFDYDIPQNGFWLRRIKDEVRKVTEHVHLGKFYYRVLGRYFFIGFFLLIERVE